MYSQKIIQLSGLVEVDRDALGQRQFIGTDEQWRKAEELRKAEIKIPVKNLDNPMQKEIDFMNGKTEFAQKYPDSFISAMEQETRENLNKLTIK